MGQAAQFLEYDDIVVVIMFSIRVGLAWRDYV